MKMCESGPWRQGKREYAGGPQGGFVMGIGRWVAKVLEGRASLA